jgi:hypothetical protein
LEALEKEQARLAANSAQALRALKTRAIAEQTAGRGFFLALQFTATNLILQLKPLPWYDAIHLSVVAVVAQELLECFWSTRIGLVPILRQNRAMIINQSINHFVSTIYQTMASPPPPRKKHLGPRLPPEDEHWYINTDGFLSRNW